MILVCELECWGLAHVPINAAFLAIVKNAFPKEAIVFAGEQSHIKEVQRQINKSFLDSIDWLVLKLPHRFTSPPQRFVSDLKVIKRLLKMNKIKHRGHILITSNNMSILIALKLLLFFSYRNSFVQVILHSELTALNIKRSRNPFLRYQNIRTAIGFMNIKNLQYIVLEEYIKVALLRKMPQIRDQVEFVNHPIPSERIHSLPLKRRSVVHFGFLGFANRSKGFPLYLKLAEKFKKKYTNHVKFHVIGMLHPALKPIKLNILDTKPRNDMLSREEYINKLQSVYYVCLPYQEKHYELCASGALLDAIAFEKPMITTDLPMFQNLFRNYGDIGYLCANSDEMESTIENIIGNFDEGHYRHQVNNLRELKKTRTVKFLSQKYRNIVEKGIENTDG